MRAHTINQRFAQLESRVSKTEEKIDFFVKAALLPVEGIFYQGQIFDAYVFASVLIETAKKRNPITTQYYSVEPTGRQSRLFAFQDKKARDELAAELIGAMHYSLSMLSSSL